MNHPLRRSNTRLTGAAITAAVVLAAACGGGSSDNTSMDQATETAQARNQTSLAAQGRHIFRFETFGDEAKWTDALRMHEVIRTSVDPLTAFSVGLKVDVDALPDTLKAALAAGTVDLHSPATTVALLKLDAVLGIKGAVETVNGVDTLTKVGITCALCHSTVDNSFAPNIGKRLDGWPNLDLNPGAIIALSPAISPTEKTALNSWGPGMYDPRHNIDGLSKPVVIPPAYGLAGVHSVTYTGDGNEIAYWNRYVAVTQMGGLGTFTEPRLNLSFTNGTVDLVSSKLPALQAYQLSLNAPPAPAGSVDAAAAARGKLVFDGPGQCATCHSGTLFTDANSTLHPPADSVVEPETPSYASRSATKMYRTTPLRGLWQHAPYFHDGSAATLEDLGNIYNAKRSLGLTPQQITDLAQYLKSL